MKKIYYNGDFLTLEDIYVEAILIEDSRIKKIGKKDEIMMLKDNNTELIDLNGNTIMPAFIDGHSHFLAMANELLQVCLNECKNFEEIKNKLLQFKNINKIKDGMWIIANGYDNNNLIEKKNINNIELDKILPNNPVIIKHKSGHSGILNSIGLKILGITKDTISPEGGKIEKKDGYLTGYLEENAFIQNIKKIPMPETKELLNNLNKTQEKYASYGITTIQEGYLTKELIPIYKEIVDNNKLTLDVVAYFDEKCMNIIETEFKDNIKKYKNNFKIGGVKIFLDGSPQGRTAWMRTPYIGNKNYYGYGTMQDSEVEKIIKKAYDKNLQLLAHCNGDKAIEQYINAIKNIEKNIKNLRPVLVHGQLLGIDQLDEIKELGIIPSFFIAHIYYWGSVHVKNFGLERAKRISPAKSCKSKEVLFTFHQDSPVIEPNMFETIWSAVNRETKSGDILGEEEKIDVLDAIKAVTMNVAYQYFEEEIKGSFKEGKVADLIIIDKNPIKVEKGEIKNIRILETIKHGKTIFKSFSNS